MKKRGGHTNLELAPSITKSLLVVYAVSAASKLLDCLSVCLYPDCNARLTDIERARSELTTPGY